MKEIYEYLLKNSTFDNLIKNYIQGNRIAIIRNNEKSDYVINYLQEYILNNATVEGVEKKYKDLNSCYNLDSIKSKKLIVLNREINNNKRNIINTFLTFIEKDNLGRSLNDLYSITKKSLDFKDESFRFFSILSKCKEVIGNEEETVVEEIDKIIAGNYINIYIKYLKFKGNKKFEIITAGLVVIVVIGAIIFANVKGTLNKGKDIFDEKDITSSKWNILKEFIPNDDLVKFNIDAPNASLEIIKTDEKEIKIQCTNNDNSQYKINQKGNDIIIEKKEKLELFKWNIKGDNIKIEIPSTLIASIDADTSNGAIILNDIEANNIYMDTSNGEIIVENVNVKEDIKIDTSNGGIEVLNVSAENIILDSSNSEAILNNINGKKIKVDISNGEIKVNECRGNKVVLDTSNGEIEAYECYANNLKLDTSNAEITLENLKDKEFVIDILEVSTSNASENINAKYNNKK